MNLYASIAIRIVMDKHKRYAHWANSTGSMCNISLKIGVYMAEICNNCAEIVPNNNNGLPRRLCLKTEHVSERLLNACMFRNKTISNKVKLRASSIL